MTHQSYINNGKTCSAPFPPPVPQSRRIELIPWDEFGPGYVPHERYPMVKRLFAISIIAFSGATQFLNYENFRVKIFQ